MLKTHLKRVILFAILGAIVGGVLYQVSPKVYESSVELLIATEPTATTSAVGQTDAAQILSTGQSQNVGTEISILKSKGLFLEALRRLPEAQQDPAVLRPENYESLYTMYEVMGDRDSRAAMVVVKAHDPKLAADLANNIGDVYNEIRERSSEESIKRAMQVLQTQSSNVNKALKGAEIDLKLWKEKNGITDVASKTSQLTGFQSTLTTQLQAAQADLAVQETTLAAMRTHVGDRPEMVEDTKAEAQPPLVAKLDDQLSSLETSRIEALRTYTPNSRKIKDLDALIATTKERLATAKTDQWRQTNRTWVKDPVHKQFADAIATGEVSKTSLQRRISAINAALSQVNDDIKKLPQAEVDVMEKSRTLAILASKYQNLEAALGDLKFKGDAGMQQARKLFPAESQGKPVAPDLTRLLIVCTLGGSIIGFLFSLARESLRATAQTSNELSGILGLPVSATVPLLQPRQAKAVFRSLPDPTFKPLESFKFMAFAMLYGKDKAPKRVLFTSVGGGVGCSTSSAQYAIAAAKTGINVVLMDADLRHETITKAFDAGDKSGLREVINCLLLASDTADITVPTEHPTLRIVPAGSAGGDGITDVPVGNLSAFLDDLQTKADLIVIDAPPCDVVSDAMRFTPYVDEVVLVCSAKFTKYTSVLPAIDLLKRAGAESVRLVMTGTSPEEEAFSRRSLYVVR